jgi:probable rRNA maturation factor
VDIDIAIRDESWVSVTADLEGVIGAAINQIQDILDRPKLGELSIALVDDADIQALNRDYRHKDKATNVLSFPQEGPFLGDIVLALETVQREAAEKSISLEHHVSHLLIHGFLHLQGYDHETDETAREMEALEIAALAALNIDNPYEIHD